MAETSLPHQLLLGKALVLGLLLGRALCLLGDPLHLVLCLLGFLLGLLYDGIPGLTHNLVFPSRLREGEPNGRPDTDGQGSDGQRVLLQHTPEPVASLPGTVPSLTS